MQTTRIERTAARWPARHTILVLCFLAAFICYIDRVNISVAVLAMQERFGWSETVKGFVLSSFFIGYMLFQVPSGYLANRYGGKWVLGVAVAWWSLFTLITPLAAVSLPLLIAARIGMGLGEAAMFPGAYNLFGRWIPLAERSRSVALLLSGVPIGNVVALLSSGWLVAHYGWPSAFYVFGAMGVVWVAVWMLRAHDNPLDHPRLSDDERALLAPLQETRAPKDASPGVPWRTLLALPPVWALIANHFCSNWGLYMLLAWLPSYFRKAQGFSIEYAGLYSAAPWLIMFLTINLSGWLADALIRRGVDLTLIRKGMQTFGLVGSSACLLLADNVAAPLFSILLMCGALGALGFTWSGFLPNHLDIAPRYADVLMGITNTAGTIPGIFAVAVTGWLVDVSGSYQTAFTLTAAVNMFGLAVWLLFGTAKRVMD